MARQQLRDLAADVAAAERALTGDLATLPPFLTAKKHFAAAYIVAELRRLDPAARVVLLRCAAAIKDYEAASRSTVTFAEIALLAAGANAEHLHERHTDFIQHRRALATAAPTKQE